MNKYRSIIFSTVVMLFLLFGLNAAIAVASDGKGDSKKKEDLLCIDTHSDISIDIGDTYCIWDDGETEYWWVGNDGEVCPGGEEATVDDIEEACMFVQNFWTISVTDCNDKCKDPKERCVSKSVKPEQNDEGEDKEPTISEDGQTCSMRYNRDCECIGNKGT